MPARDQIIPVETGHINTKISRFHVTRLNRYNLITGRYFIHFPFITNLTRLNRHNLITGQNFRACPLNQGDPSQPA